MSIFNIINDFKQRMYKQGFSYVLVEFTRFSPMTGERLYNVVCVKNASIVSKEVSLSQLKDLPRF